MSNIGSYFKKYPIHKFVFVPILLYFIVFIVFTYPAIFSFSTHFFSDKWDGFQNVWNLWWVNKALTEFDQSIWYTNYQFYPRGVSLLAHTLNPFNGFFAVFLLKFFSLVQTYNLIVVFTYIAGGFFMFILAFYLSSSYTGSLISGFLFSFANFHFAHTEGHLQTTSIEFIPLSIFSVFLFIKKPKFASALFMSCVFYFLILCDYYFFFYLLLASFCIYVWHALLEKHIFFVFKKKYITPFLIFLITFFLTSGKVILSLLRQNSIDPLYGSHIPEIFSADLFSYIIPGGHWRYSSLTSWFWGKLPGNIHESSIHLGLSALIFLILVKRTKKLIKDKSIRFFLALMLFFALLSFGPVFHIFGRSFPVIPMPYTFLEKLFPFLSLSGVPVRMAVMVVLSYSVIFALSFEYIRKIKKGRMILTLFIVLVVFEYLPKPLTLSSSQAPDYVSYIKNRQGLSPVLDLANHVSVSLYHQTIHEKPLNRGYVARLPKSTAFDDALLSYLFHEGKFMSICTLFDTELFIIRKPFEKISSEYLLYEDNEIMLFDLGKYCLDSQKKI